MKKKIDIIYVVLVYKNYSDFLEFYESVKITNENFKIVLVNSFYDEQSKKYGIKIAKQTNCDFISIDNRGYGYGNNVGIEYALENYEFKFLIISNPDIEIIKLPINRISNNSISGPKIINKKDRNQNPHYFKKNRISFFLLKKYVDTEISFLLYIYLISNKIFRWISKFRFKISSSNAVFALHGSFMIFPIHILKKMKPIFDERVFLYSEENHVAEKALKDDIRLVYNPDLEVFHKEDGSSSNVNTKKHTLDSLKIYFSNWEI